MDSLESITATIRTLRRSKVDSEIPNSPKFTEETDNFGFSWVPFEYKLNSSNVSSKYIDLLKKDSSFHNPKNISLMANAYGLKEFSSSLLVDPSTTSDWNVETLLDDRKIAMSQKFAIKGVALCREESYALGLEAFETALKYYNKNTEALVGKGAALANTGELRRAIHYFETALAIDPTHKNAMLYLDKTKSKMNDATKNTCDVSSSATSKTGELVAEDGEVTEYEYMDNAKEGSKEKHKKSKKRKKKDKKSRHKHQTTDESGGGGAKPKEGKKSRKKHKKGSKHSPSSPSSSSSSSEDSSAEEFVHPILQRQKHALWNL